MIINATFGITKTPFMAPRPALLPQQERIADYLKTHSQHGGFSVIVGEPGVGKTVLRETIESLENPHDTAVASFSRTLHTYRQILHQLADALKVEPTANHLEKNLITAAEAAARKKQTLFVLIDEAHLLDIHNLRRLRLLFDRFPKQHNLVLFGQPDLMVRLRLLVNRDIRDRITFSHALLPLTDDDLKHYIEREMTTAQLSLEHFETAAVELILRHVHGNLRLTRNLCLASLVEACRDNQRQVTIGHVNTVLIQPHWRDDPTGEKNRQT
jgi:type II secretory pathway predicted ATPase ExeA